MPLGKSGMNKHHVHIASFPFVRITIPFIAGILSYAIFPHLFFVSAVVVLAIICQVASLGAKKSLHSSLRPFLSSIAIFLFFVSLGWTSAAISKPPALPESALYTPCCIKFQIEEIRHKNLTTELFGNAGIGEKDIHLAITLKGNDYRLLEGDILFCSDIQIKPITGSLMPEAFNYATFMKRNGFLYKAYIVPGNFKKIGHKDNLHTYSSLLRTYLIQRIRQIGLDANTSDFSITIFTGKRHIAEQNRAMFSNSGLAHILAVSGLHIGIIIFITSIIFRPLRRFHFVKIFYTTTLITVWLYVFFTGFPPSAVRAGIMGTFVFGAKGLLKRHSPLNALFASAFFILLFAPDSIYDIGFQLSFLSVLGILLFSDSLTIRTNSRILNYAFSTIAVTLAAQLGTAVLIIYHFNTFPTSFLLSNVLVIPILPLFISLLLPAILLSCISLKWSVLNFALERIYFLIQTLPDKFIKIFPAIDGIWLDGFSAVLISIAIFSTGTILFFRLKRPFLYFPAAIIFLSILSIVSQKLTLPDSGTLITDGYSSTNIIAYHGKSAYIINSRNDTSEISQCLEDNRRFFIKHNFDSIFKVQTVVQKPDLYISYPFVFANGKRFVFIQGNYRKHCQGKMRLATDYAILTNNYYNQLSDLPDYIEADTIIIPNEIHEERRDTLIAFARRNKIPFI